jgi:hypothetical protein
MAVQGVGACPECRAAQQFGTCVELFHELLARDHERKLPFAAWHTLNVAGYLLQHPGTTSENVLAGQWEVARRFASHGLDGVHAIVKGAVRRNSHRAANKTAAPSTALEAPVMSHLPAVTIEDVSVDGTFPAEGYEERMTAWILDIVRTCSD